MDENWRLFIIPLSLEYLDYTIYLSEEEEESNGGDALGSTGGSESFNAGIFRMESLPEGLHQVKLELISHDECVAGHNRTVPRYLICSNHSYGGGCPVSIISFNFIYSLPHLWGELHEPAW